MGLHKILIVDDDTNISNLLRLYLEKENFSTIIAEDGEKAVELFKTENPDLILLDGGLGQVSAVKAVLEKFGLNIPLFGMVKDDKHRTRAIVNEQGEISININRRLFTFISAMQDEVHRFAISYHRTRRKKTQLGVSLTEIDGIGQERAKALLKHFRTIANIKAAELSELKAAPKMNESAALSVYWHFRRKEKEEE